MHAKYLPIIWIIQQRWNLMMSSITSSPNHQHYQHTKPELCWWIVCSYYLHHHQYIDMISIYKHYEPFMVSTLSNFAVQTKKGVRDRIMWIIFHERDCQKSVKLQFFKSEKYFVYKKNSKSRSNTYIACSSDWFWTTIGNVNFFWVVKIIIIAL